jgi:hypothetical protein
VELLFFGIGIGKTPFVFAALSTEIPLPPTLSSTEPLTKESEEVRKSGKNLDDSAQSQVDGDIRGNSGDPKKDQESEIPWIHLSSQLSGLFPDPFQAYVFSGLLLWLFITVILLRREWKKSSRIVLDVFLQQGPGTLRLID